MPYKDKLKDRGAHKELMRKRREGLTGLTGVTKEGVTKSGVTDTGVTEEGVTGLTGLTGVTEYPAVIEALVDPVKRAKLEKIYHSLASHNVEAQVRYGLWGPTFDIIGELLEVTTGVWPK